MKRTASFIAKTQTLFINRNFALLWFGQVISMLGDYVFTTTLTLWVVTTIARGQSWASLAVSGLLIASTLPTFLIGPFAGVFTDRWEKRRTLLWMDTLQALLILSLLLVTVLDSAFSATWWSHCHCCGNWASRMASSFVKRLRQVLQSLFFHIVWRYRR